MYRFKNWNVNSPIKRIATVSLICDGNTDFVVLCVDLTCNDITSTKKKNFM
jgi:hypothetical protein